MLIKLNYQRCQLTYVSFIPLTPNYVNTANSETHRFLHLFIFEYSKSNLHLHLGSLIYNLALFLEVILQLMMLQ